MLPYQCMEHTFTHIKIGSDGNKIMVFASRVFSVLKRTSFPPARRNSWNPAPSRAVTCNRVAANTRNKPWNATHAAFITDLIQSSLSPAFSDSMAFRAEAKKKTKERKEINEKHKARRCCAHFLHCAAPLQPVAFVGFGPNLHPTKKMTQHTKLHFSRHPGLLCETPSQTRHVSALHSTEMKHSKAPLPDCLCLLTHVIARSSLRDSLRKLNGLNWWSIFNVCWQRSGTNARLH